VPIAADLAQHLGGGGHAYASGFKTADGRSFDTVKADCLQKAEELLP
jgi:nanoRNase/pAp phosphatase (c-di-AMP/oligoRNAs hydrolase)